MLNIVDDGAGRADRGSEFGLLHPAMSTDKSNP
jgi:hypothetical protein